MGYDFDEPVDRRGTNSIKHDFAAEYAKPEGLVPLWVADMDFRTAPCVTEALVRSAEHAVFGYSEARKNGEYFSALRNWFAQRFDFQASPEWLVKTPGVVFALCSAIRAFTEPGDAVLIQPPVYYPFRTTVESNGRRLVTNPLAYHDGRYLVDFDDFEEKIAGNDVRLFVLCSPHNPVGRVWTREELTRMGEICLRHGVLVVSDEIHCDFVFGDNRHTVFGTIGESFLVNSIICTSPSKTFNLAGLQTANIFIADGELRRKFADEIGRAGYSQLNTMGLVSCRAAYEGGGEWLDGLLAYLWRNYDYARNFVNANLPKVRVVGLEGTYLLWLDMNGLGFSEAELDRIIVERAGLWVSRGGVFGDEGKGFIRINLACPFAVIEKAFGCLGAALG